ncbi:MAG: hypothetical protein AAF846_22980 [Chloroflexota bacterium]
MCRHLTTLGKNEYKQLVMICEHGSIHLVNQYTAIVMTGQTFQALATFVQNDCLNIAQGQFRCYETVDEQIELWICDGAFQLTTRQFEALTELVRVVAYTVKITPLAELVRGSQYKSSDFSSN